MDLTYLQTSCTRAVVEKIMSFARLTVSLILYVIVFLALISLSKCDDVKLFDFDVIPGGQKGEFESEKWVSVTFSSTGGTETVHRRDSSPTHILETVHRQNWRQFNDIFEDVHR